MLNKTIWLLWLQGWENVPWLVKQVAQSWEINNPDWTVEYVTLENLHHYVQDIDYLYDQDKNILPQHKADIIRLSLLKNHGGVWADATMLCMQPLSHWVEEAVNPAGLWMYHGHGDGMGCQNGPSIWFIVSQKNSLMIERWKQACDRYWHSRTEADSYLWLDRLFKQLHKTDAEFRHQWKLAPYLYSEAKGQAHSLARSKKMTSNDPALKAIFRERPPYALKLWWKKWNDNFPDISSTDCQNSNGYYAIQLSKQPSVFKHEMGRKNSLLFSLKSSISNAEYLLTQRLRTKLSLYVRGLLAKAYS